MAKNRAHGSKGGSNTHRNPAKATPQQASAPRPKKAVPAPTNVVRGMPEPNRLFPQDLTQILLPLVAGGIGLQVALPEPGQSIWTVGFVIVLFLFAAVPLAIYLAVRTPVFEKRRAAENRGWSWRVAAGFLVLLGVGLAVISALAGVRIASWARITGIVIGVIGAVGGIAQYVIGRRLGLK